MRIVVTGAKGMLGSDVCQVLRETHEIIGYDIDDFDVTDETKTLDSIVGASPEVVVHLAAFTDVEACEDERSTAFAVNALGTLNVAKAARQARANLVFLSTDYVFDGGKRDPYTELDQTGPLNFYGLTKLFGEYYVRTLTLKHLIIRTSWLFGPNGRNFVDTILAKASESGRVRVVNDQTGCPTYSMDLARAIRRIVDRQLEGIIHLSNTGQATWFDLAGHAISLAGIEARVEPIPTESYPAKAARPAYSVLGSQVLGASGLGSLPSWQEGVRAYLERKGMLKKG